jgi:hypothetical protein
MCAAIKSVNPNDKTQVGDFALARNELQSAWQRLTKMYEKESSPLEAIIDRIQAKQHLEMMRLLERHPQEGTAWEDVYKQCVARQGTADGGLTLEVTEKYVNSIGYGAALCTRHTSLTDVLQSTTFRVGGGRGGRLRTAALVGSRYAVSFLGLASLRADSLGRLPGRHPAPRPWDRRQLPARLLASLPPPADRPRVPCLSHACRLQPAHLVAWLPLTATADAASTPRETRQNSRRQWPSRLLSPLSPPADRPRVSDNRTLPEYSPRPIFPSVYTPA